MARLFNFLLIEIVLRYNPKMIRKGKIRARTTAETSDISASQRTSLANGGANRWKGEERKTKQTCYLEKEQK
jgi:hypothetical protein